MLTLFTPAVGRARIPIKFSQGFILTPNSRFATALSVGVESWAEYFDMEIAAGFGAEMVKEGLNAILPEGVLILDAGAISAGQPVPGGDHRQGELQRYSARKDPGRFAAAGDAFLARETFPLRREKKGRLSSLTCAGKWWISMSAAMPWK